MKGNKIIVSSVEIFETLSKLSLSGEGNDYCHFMTRNNQLVIVSQSKVESIDLGYDVPDQEFKTDQRQLLRLMKVCINILEQPILLKFKDSEIYIKAVI